MPKITLLILSLICVAALLGCYKSEPASNANSTTTNANKAASTPATSTSSNTTAAADKVGVPECDEFITKYDACVSDKVPEAARAQYKTTVAQWRKSWHDLAANPQTKATLAAACKQAAESARTSMKSYNCTF